MPSLSQDAYLYLSSFSLICWCFNSSAHSFLSAFFPLIFLFFVGSRMSDSSSWKPPIIVEKDSYDLFLLSSVFNTRWISVLTNSKEEALTMAFRGEQSTGENSLEDLTKAIIEDVQRLPGNEVCCDCGSSGVCPLPWLILLNMLPFLVKSKIS